MIRLRKVIDMQDESKEFQDAVFECGNNWWSNFGQSTYCEWNVGGYDIREYGETQETKNAITFIDQYLKRKGCKNDDEVIILAWW